MIRSLERLLPYLLLFPAVLPIVFTDGLLYPYLTPKTLLFRADFLLVLAAFTVLTLSGHPFFFSRLRNPLTWIPAGLLAWSYVASLFGVDFYHSFWSIFDRGDGLLTLTAIIGFFYFVLVSADEYFATRLMKVVAVVATLVSVFALLQWVEAALGIDIPLLPITAGGRIGSTLGNAAFLASYLSMSLFVTLIVARDLTASWRPRAYVSAILQLLAIIVSATRGALLALLVAAFLTLVYLALYGEARVKRYAQIGVVALLLGAGLFFAFRAQLTHIPFEPIQRVASISLSDATVESRLFIWQTVGREALHSPLLGVGAENIEVLFNRVYDPTAIVEQWFDRTHNAFLDYLVQYGVIGLALYLALIVVFAWKALALARDIDSGAAQTGGLLLLLLLVYILQNFFVFDTAVTLWLLCVLFALLFISEGKQYALVATRIPVVFSLALGALVTLLIIPVSLIPLRANMLLADGYRYHVYDVRRADDSIEKGYALGGYADLEYGYQLYEMYTDRQMTMLTGEARVIAYRRAENILGENFENYPYDARTATYYAHVLDVPPPEVVRDDEKLRTVIARAIELSPKRIQPWYLLANISIRAGDALPQGDPEKKKHYEDAVAVLSEYAAHVPLFSEPRFVIATLYLTMGDRELAKQWADEALPLYTKPDEAIARRASRYYVTVEDWPNAIQFLQDIVALEPTDHGVKYDLAKAEFLNGNVERAKQIVDELRVEAPGLVESDPKFLQAIGVR